MNCLTLYYTVSIQEPHQRINIENQKDLKNQEKIYKKILNIPKLIEQGSQIRVSIEASKSQLLKMS